MFMQTFIKIFYVQGIWLYSLFQNLNFGNASSIPNDIWQSLRLHLVNINAYAKFYQNIPNGLELSTFFTNKYISVSSWQGHRATSWCIFQSKSNRIIGIHDTVRTAIASLVYMTPCVQQSHHWYTWHRAYSNRIIGIHDTVRTAIASLEYMTPCVQQSHHWYTWHRAYSNRIIGIHDTVRTAIASLVYMTPCVQQSHQWYTWHRAYQSWYCC